METTPRLNKQKRRIVGELCSKGLHRAREFDRARILAALGCMKFKLSRLMLPAGAANRSRRDRYPAD